MRSIRLSLATVLPFVGVAAILSQTTPILNKGANPADPEGILIQLAPDDGPPPSLALKPAEKARAIRLLVAVKRDETGWHRQLAIYLLATLGYDYERNREELLRVWRKDGDDGTMGLLIGLYDQGHKEFLQPLLAGYNGMNAAASEGLGTFYSEQLEKNPRGFLAVLSTFSPRRQLVLCTVAGGTDGGGMGPKTEGRVLANLKEIGGEVAQRCARGVRVGNPAADKANDDLSTEPAKK
ncbi:MAG: hypothetical protein ABSG51_16620 [Terracidiphilus sp.]